MNVLTIYRKDLEFGLRSEGFTARKINQFCRVFQVVESSQGDMLELDSTRAMLVYVNNSEQGLSREDFITAWWVYWVVVFNESSNNIVRHQALGAIRALFFISACVRNSSVQTTMQMWWRDCEPLHGYPTLEAI